MPRSAVSLSSLIPDPRNARRHTDRNIDVIAASLQEVRAGRSIVIDEKNTILAGNATVEAAMRAGFKGVHVVDVDGEQIVAVRRRNLTKKQKARLALFDNRAAELADGWSPEVLQQLEADGVSLEGMFTPEELEDLYATVDAGEYFTSPDAVPELTDTDIQPGDLFKLGKHLLLCGDSTKPDDVERVLRGAKPELMATDPPYGVNYDPTWRAKAGVNKSRKKLGAVTNDDQADCTEAFRLFPGDVAYVYHAAMKCAVVQASLERAGFAPRAQIVWAKDRMVLGRGDYHWQHETIWYAVRDGQPGRRTRDRSPCTLWRIGTPVLEDDPPNEQSSVWEIGSRDDGGHGHGTQKPVECLARPMRNHLAPTVYDPFCGSGTALIAATMLARSCYAVELEPRYVQCALTRWEAFTKQTAAKVADQARRRKKASRAS